MRTCAVAFAFLTLLAGADLAERVREALASRNDPPFVGRSLGPWRCDDLRPPCLHKWELGKNAEGNCRWYRDNCR